MGNNSVSTGNNLRMWRLLIAGVVGVLIVGGLILVILAVGGSIGSATGAEQQVNVLANSDNECVECHERTTPGIVE